MVVFDSEPTLVPMLTHVDPEGLPVLNMALMPIERFPYMCALVSRLSTARRRAASLTRNHAVGRRDRAQRLRTDRLLQLPASRKRSQSNRPGLIPASKPTGAKSEKIGPSIALDSDQCLPSGDENRHRIFSKPSAGFRPHFVKGPREIVAYSGPASGAGRASADMQPASDMFQFTFFSRQRRKIPSQDCQKQILQQLDTNHNARLALPGFSGTRPGFPATGWSEARGCMTCLSLSAAETPRPTTYEHRFIVAYECHPLGKIPQRPGPSVSSPSRATESSKSTNRH